MKVVKLRDKTALADAKTTFIYILKCIVITLMLIVSLHLNLKSKFQSWIELKSCNHASSSPSGFGKNNSFLCRFFICHHIQKITQILVTDLPIPWKNSNVWFKISKNDIKFLVWGRWHPVLHFYSDREISIDSRIL